MAAASWGDEAMDALKRILAEIDSGKNVDEVLGDELQDMGDLSRRIGFGKKKKTADWMTPEQRRLHEEASARQREYVARLRREQEEAEMAQRMAEVEDDEKFLMWLRDNGFDV